MASIRRSLSLYVLALFALALGVVGLVADRIITAQLVDHEKAVARYIQNQYESLKREHIKVIEEEMSSKANFLSLQLQFEYATLSYQEAPKCEAYVLATGLYSYMPNPLAASTWYVAAINNRTPFHVQFVRHYFFNLKLDSDFTDRFDRHISDTAPQYYQINSFFSLWRSENLGDTVLPFSVGQYMNPRMGSMEQRHESNVKLPDGRAISRIVQKTPVIFLNNRTVTSRDRPNPSRDGKARDPAPPPDRRDQRPGFSRFAPSPINAEKILEQQPHVYVQVARLIRPDEIEFAKEVEWRDRELESLGLETQTTLSRIRNLVTGTSILGFIAVALGGPLIVQRGLLPVNRLSDAVGHVSEKDFRIPMDLNDLTSELVPIHARVSQTLDQLRAVFEREKQAVADISHELRTPVAALLATLDVSLRKQRTAEQYKQTLEECRIITKQLGQLVERVMTLAKIDAGQTSINITQLNALSLATDCAVIIRPLAKMNALTFEMHVEDESFYSDYDVIREILMNLLHNAIEYNRPGGTIELSHHITEGRSIWEVRDTGIGMTPEIKERIFERFYRADPSRTQTGIHAGLGLAIVKEYVERLGGTIQVESTPDVGSRFVLDLPRDA